MGIKLSHSAVNLFRQCPQKYYHSRKWRTKKRASALAFGTSVEDGITQTLLTGSLEEGLSKFYICWEHEEGDKRKPVFDNPDIEYYKSDFDKSLVMSDDEFLVNSFTKLGLDEHYDSWPDAFEDAILLKDAEAQPSYIDDQLKFMNRVYWWSLRLKGKYMISSFWDQVYPDIEKLVDLKGKSANQVKIELKNDKGDELRGFIDYLIKFKGRDKPSIVDCKTAANPYTEHEINTSDQLRTYVFALKNKYKLDCEACYLVLGKRMKKTKHCESCKEEFSSTKRKCSDCNTRLSTSFHSECQLMFTDYSDELLELEMDDYENVLKAIDSGVNFRNTNTCMAFGRPCEFYDVCWKNKKPEELDTLVKRKKGKK